MKSSSYGVRRLAAAVTLAISCSLPAALPCVAASPPALADAEPQVANRQADPAPQVELPTGMIEGITEGIGPRKLNVYLGIPYAAPPLGTLRWQDPQPLGRWSGVRPATRFAPRCLQVAERHPTSRSEAMSEDCLYLNIWAPAGLKSSTKLPVLVYFHGGSFNRGDASESRYDGAGLAGRGIVMVTVNYRLGVFGFLAHPDAARESPHAASGNYGLRDQHAALRWVRENIALFGGDPDNVTIGGDSSGSFAVSAHMASPLSRGLFARAIGQSGGAFAPASFWSRTMAERLALNFARHAGLGTLQQLRDMPAEKLLTLTGPQSNPLFQFWPHVDGHFLLDTPEAVFRSGAQARVPLLIGSNSAERDSSAVLATAEPTPEIWQHVLNQLFRDDAAEALRLYPGGNNDEVMRSATALASDLFVGHSAWRWMDLHRQTGGAPVYYYLFDHSRPAAVRAAPQSTAQRNAGAPHGASIEYALRNGHPLREGAWTDDDQKVADVFSGYIARFVKTGNPNNTRSNPLAVFAGGTPVPAVQTPPHWPAVSHGDGQPARQVIHARAHTVTDQQTARQNLLQQYFAKRKYTAFVE